MWLWAENSVTLFQANLELLRVLGFLGQRRSPFITKSKQISVLLRDHDLLSSARLAPQCSSY